MSTSPFPPLPTSDEVDRRLRIVSELRNLCLSLGKARLVETSEPATLKPPETAEVLPSFGTQSDTERAGG